MHLESRYRVIIWKSPEGVLMSVSGEIGVAYRDKKIVVFSNFSANSYQTFLIS